MITPKCNLMTSNVESEKYACWGFAVGHTMSTPMGRIAWLWEILW